MRAGERSGPPSCCQESVKGANADRNAARGVPSPYLWSGTNQYRSGKYVRDGLYDPGKVDSQLGCAALLIALMELDPDTSFAEAKIAKSSPSTNSARPSLTNPSKGSIGAFVVDLIRAVFRRK